MNCCGKRASFYCDDADKGSTSAVVLLPAKEVLPEWITNLGVANNHYADYLAAIKLASCSLSFRATSSETRRRGRRTNVHGCEGLLVLKCAARAPLEQSCCSTAGERGAAPGASGLRFFSPHFS